MIYEGAFRMPASTYGSSSLNYSEGPIAYNGSRNSIYIVGHSHHQSIAEFAIPKLVNSYDVSALNMTDDPIQVFCTVLDRSTGGNSQNINRIGGMCTSPNGDGGSFLLVNAYEYYDAPGDNSHTTITVMSPDDLIASEVKGFYQYEGGAGHTSGWISEIPDEWQSLLGGSHITGQSSGIPIISRTSVGPSAFVFTPSDFFDDQQMDSVVSTIPLLDFSLSDPLHEDLSNAGLDNDLWTHLSRATYGMIIPNTRTYMTIGYSGGHDSGVCYKCTQDNGNLCGGYCAPMSNDYYQYYWLWDMQDLVDVKNGLIIPYDVRPYDYGELATPFQNGNRQIGGASFDSENGILYLSIQKADREQGTYSNPPVIVAYSFAESVLPVQIVEFEGSTSGTLTNLFWQTEQEYQVDKYIIQSQVDNEWLSIDSVYSYGNSVSGGKYHHVLKDSEAAGTYYRLKVVDYNGDISYSKIILVDGSENMAEELMIFPNPAINNISVISAGLELESLNIYSLDGNNLISRRPIYSNSIEMDISLLRAGIYFIVVKTKGGKFFRRKLVINK